MGHGYLREVTDGHRERLSRLDSFAIRPDDRELVPAADALVVGTQPEVTSGAAGHAMIEKGLELLCDASGAPL